MIWIIAISSLILILLLKYLEKEIPDTLFSTGVVLLYVGISFLVVSFLVEFMKFG